MPSDTKSKIGRSLAKGLGIKVPLQDPLGAEVDPGSQSESTFSVGSEDTYSYLESEPTTTEWIREHTPSIRQIGLYFYNLFPFLRWITKYNLQWLLGDLIAGVTVGAVVVPQGMAYAKLADLPPQYGLYTSFMGVLIYWFFATSKDITIGPVAVMSTLVGNIITQVHKTDPEIPGPVIASALAIIVGAIVCLLGLLRLGFIVDFIPLPAISAFMTGSAINICAGQVSTMLGETAKFDTSAATYLVIINTLKYLPSSKVDAAMGTTALAMLYMIRLACSYGAKKYPHRTKLFFFASTLRTVFVILFYTMISAAVNLHRRNNPRFQILGNIPRGFQAAGVPELDSQIIRSFANQLPAAVIVLLIEHIAISKSFGRVNNYAIDPSQELIAIGITNLLGPFLGAYPATGSFTRTAIKSKAGVRTPLAGVITAIIVLLAIYCLTALFFYIPKSSLAAVIIHAVGDLITPPKTVYQFWRIFPIDAIIFFIGIIVTIFTTIEIGVYSTICASAAVLLFRVAKARGQFLGRITIHSVVGDHLVDGDGKYNLYSTNNTASEDQSNSHRSVFLPINHADGSNPDIKVEQPYRGIFIYRFSEGFNYPNANHYTDYLVKTILKNTRRTNPATYAKLGDRPWNNPGKRRDDQVDNYSHLPTLRAIILDFSSVINVDVTSIQNLIDVRNQLELYASPEPVEWHFAHINNRWTKRALAAAGFGYPAPVSAVGFHKWKPIFSVAEIGVSSSTAAHAEIGNNQWKIKQTSHQHHNTDDIESLNSGPKPEIQRTQSSAIDSKGTDHNEHRDLADNQECQSRPRVALVQGLNQPFFHIDLMSALESAVANTSEHNRVKGTADR